MTNRSMDITDAPDAPAFVAAEDLEHWRAIAAVGATAVYYQGPGLMRERVRDIRLNVTAATAWRLYLQGRAVLTQAQVAPGVFAYQITVVDLSPVVERDRNPVPSQLPAGKAIYHEAPKGGCLSADGLLELQRARRKKSRVATLDCRPTRGHMPPAGCRE